jgi:hypothetical protein
MKWSEIDRMKTSRLTFGRLAFLIVPLARGQRTASEQPLAPIETSVCKIMNEPSTYNNKLVKVRGYVRANFEYSILFGEETCPDNGIWFVFADGSAPPELAATVTGKGTPGNRNTRGRGTPPIPVRLVKDSNLEELEHYWAVSAKGEACADGPPPPFPPDCTTYRVTATFIGRVDGVSKEVHAAHLKRSSQEPADGKGFGHMGMFDAQIVVQSVEKVIAVDESVIRKASAKSQ